ncbi:hypothetical protein MPTK1_5g07860 [Marchantia polymorpha subsp. ruderalis]|nr:hypothetical protein MARPO_0198s0005 [Marchantia polymorpha]BBN10951.1 hypothetical protein Mp_5g07860 [Marchantia polymorpha subsp. ruderalis]|eukprot:PTQ27436.1 hypothetical protein MARPO_0198s0005 [Marchantia polymorpha]
MEVGERRMDLLSMLSMIELEATSGDEMEAYLFQEGDGSTIFQAGGKEHRNWKSKIETLGAESLGSICSSYCSSEICEEASTSFDPRLCNSSSEICEIISDLNLDTCYPSSSSNSADFYIFSRDKSPTPERGADGNGFQDIHRRDLHREMCLEEIEEESRPPTLDKSPSYFLKEIGSIISAQVTLSESEGRQSKRSMKKRVRDTSACNNDNDDGGLVSEAHPVQAVEVSLRRWLDFLENHDVSASYKDLVHLRSFTKRFMNLVEFFLFTLVDILITSSHFFDTSLDYEDGVLFPPLSSFIEDAAGEREMNGTCGDCSTSADHRSRQDKSELQRLQEWLMDGIDYLGSQEIVAYYEDYQVLHATTKQLLELVDSYFRNVVDRLLKQCAGLVGQHEIVLMKSSERTSRRENL